MHLRLLPTVAATLAGVAGCCSMGPPSPPQTVEALKPPGTQYVHLEALADGVQIYECAAKSGGGYEWAFKSPEAALADRAGKSIGKHYGGPTWESNDGSKVTGETKARDAGPDSTAIPWLLLNAKSSSGTGVFASTRSVQRVATKGGIAPTEACGADNIGKVARVPYTATYYFYRDKP